MRFALACFTSLLISCSTEPDVDGPEGTYFEYDITSPVLFGRLEIHLLDRGPTEKPTFDVPVTAYHFSYVETISITRYRELDITAFADATSSTPIAIGSIVPRYTSPGGTELDASGAVTLHTPAP